MAKIVSIEFGICAKDSNGNETYGLIPVDKAVQKVLQEMLSTTRKLLNRDNLERFEPAQKYSENETLWLPIEDINIEKIKLFYELENIDNNPNLLKQFKQLFFYFAVFNLDNGKKIIGVRRTAQFKGVVSAKGRLVQFIDDSLQISEDNIFKLDHHFDFIIQKSKVLILSPSSLALIANLNDYIKSTAASALNTMSKNIKFMSFDTVVKYVSSHIRSAKLVASLRARNDLHLISKNKFISYCDENNIPYELNADGLIIPVKGKELDFLQVLDRRRFTAELIEGSVERYEAPNRKGVS